MTSKKTYTRPDTVLAVAGRDPANNFGIVNPPVYHASTILSPTMEKFENRIPFEGFGYGRNGTPTQKALEDAVAAIEGAHRSIAVQSGLGAVTGAIVGFLKSGDHMLVTDNAYGPARRFSNTTLKNFGVETTYFDPMIGAGIEKMIRPNTKIVYLEAPGSQTFEVQDVDTIAAVAREHGAIVIADNTWATPLYFKPFEHGCDISVHAGTKYIVGHSDAMMGIISCATRQMFETAKTACQSFGFHAAPDDCYLALRGLRTMAVRLRHHEKSGVEMAHWLKGRPEVDKVLHPALPDCPRPRQLEAPVQGRVRPVLLHAARRLQPQRARRHARRHGHLRHGRELGRLREPAYPGPSRPVSHRRAVAQGQAPAARAYRAGGRRGSQDRSRRGLRAIEPGAQYLTVGA
jgi:cystathionine beta-lyase